MRKKLVVVVAPRCVDIFCLCVMMTVPGEKVLIVVAPTCIDSLLYSCDDDSAR